MRDSAAQFIHIGLQYGAVADSFFLSTNRIGK